MTKNYYMMPLPKTDMKDLIKSLYILIFLFAPLLSVFSQQDNQFVKFKIDGVAAVVGDFIILDSDIDKTLIDLESQGVSVEDFNRCSLSFFIPNTFVASPNSVISISEGN